MLLKHLAPATNLIWRYLENQQIDPLPIFVGVGINPELLKMEDARISVKKVDALWECLLKAVIDPCFTVEMAKLWHPSAMGALGYAWLASACLRKAFTRVKRYGCVVSENITLDIRDTKHGLEISVRVNHIDHAIAHRHQLILAVFMHLCRLNSGEDIKPVAVAMAMEKPNYAKCLTDYYRADIKFNANEWSLTIARDDAEKKLTTACHQLAFMHDEVLNKYLICIEQGDFIHQVQSVMLDYLPEGKITVNELAKMLNQSQRTLQRRLKENNTTFIALLAEVREIAAKQYLRNHDNNLNDIAFLLGFTDQSSFSNAFKKWTGRSPAEYRRGRQVSVG